jgi:hypothetical protein
MTDKIINYQTALIKISLMENWIKTKKELNAFDRSLILSLLFDMDKEKVLDDIINVRNDNLNKNDNL